MRTKIVLLACLLSLTFLSAKPTNRLKIDRIETALTFDGVIDEEAWLKINSVKMVMFLPNFNETPTEKSEIRLAYDDEFLHVSAILYDHEPDKIQVTSNKRDGWNLSNDIFGIIIDTFNDKENGLAFYTNPVGSRWDFTIFNDAVGGFPVNISWNTFWDVKTTIDEKGWNVEMRIPLSSLRFDAANGEVVMGIIPWRWIARKNESSIYPAIPNQWGWWSQVKPSMAQEIVLSGIKNKNPLYIAPYVSGGFSRNNELNDGETKYNRIDEFKYDFGLDLKYGITSNLTADLTINTDFAQVEADDQQINLTRFSLFFPEKRLFFQERAAVFDFRFGGPNRLFYSRRIGLNDGQQVPILGGARLIGRIGQWDLGFLDMQTAKQDSFPSENFGVLRLRRSVINENSFIGGMVTNRIANDGTQNSTMGVDGIFRIFEDDYFNLTLAHTYDTESGNNLGDLKQVRLVTYWERRRFDGFNYGFNYSFQGKNYEPGMGFKTRENYRRSGLTLGYGWIMDGKHFLQRHNFSLRNAVYERNDDGSIETAESRMRWEFVTKRGYNFSVRSKLSYENISDTLNFTDEVDIIPGEYDFYNFEGDINTPSGDVFGAGASFGVGSFYDGTQVAFTLSPRWIVNADFSLSFNYEFNKLNFESRNQNLTAHILRLRSSLTLSPALSLSGFVQFNSAANLIITNARLRYNPEEGNDLYIVYNEDTNSDRHRDLPTLPVFNNRTILLKYTYTFVVD